MSISFEKLCKKLKQTLSNNDEKRSLSYIEMITEMISDHISLLSTESFLSLPIDQIIHIVEQLSIEISVNNIEFIKKFITDLIGFHPNNRSILYLLDILRVDDQVFVDFPEFMNIISSFSNCSLLKQLFKSYSIFNRSANNNGEVHANADKNNKPFYDKPFFVPVFQKPIDYESDIFTAIENKKMESIQYIVEVERINPEEIKDKRFQMSPLHYACKTSNIYAAQYFIEKAPKLINSIDKYGATPLLIACRYGHKDIVKYLIEYVKVDHTIKDKAGHTPLHMAAEKGNIEIFDYLLSTGLFDLEAKDANGYTPLHYSCFRGRLQVTQYLVELAKVNINAINNNRYTPLHISSATGNSEIIIYLLSKGADKTARNSNSLTPAGVACEYCKDKSKAYSIKQLFN